MQQATMTERSSASNPTVEHPWAKTKEEVTSFYNVDEATGLTEERVREGLQRYGHNGTKLSLHLPPTHSLTLVDF